MARSARLLGLSRDTVRYRMQRYGITCMRPIAPSAPRAAELEVPVTLRMPMMEPILPATLP